MTKRERYLNALRNQEVDELVWAPNFDYWLHVNRSEGTLPEKYRDMSRNDIVRAIGGHIWNRAQGLRTVLDESVQEIFREDGDDTVHEYVTPIGSIKEVYRVSEGRTSALALVEHFVKDLETLSIMKYVVEATNYEADYGPTLQALEETGDDGIVLNSNFCVPFIQFAKTDAGYVNGFYLWIDYKAEVEGLIQKYFAKFLEGYKILADGPADVVATGDNMDGTMISPKIFKEYAVPFYQEAKKIISSKDKIFEGHWCGRTESLLPFVPDCGLDVVEAIVTRPMADIELGVALDSLDGKVVLQGGVPSVLICEAGGTRGEFEEYMRQVILPLKGRRGFILGMSDNVPPNADFTRVERVSQLIS